MIQIDLNTIYGINNDLTYVLVYNIYIYCLSGCLSGCLPVCFWPVLVLPELIPVSKPKVWFIFPSKISTVEPLLTKVYSSRWLGHPVRGQHSTTGLFFWTSLRTCPGQYNRTVQQNSSHGLLFVHIQDSTTELSSWSARRTYPEQYNRTHLLVSSSYISRTVQQNSSPGQLFVHIPDSTSKRRVSSCAWLYRPDPWIIR